MNDDELGSTFGIPSKAVLQDYKSCPALIGNDDWKKLHMFFSPHCIPIGLTDDEVRVCVTLYPLRKNQYDRERERRMRVLTEKDLNEYNDDPAHVMGNLIWAHTAVFNLPEELRPLGVMTRRRFIRGIRKFLLEAHK